MAVWNVWHSDYWISGWLKTVTALVSLFTAAMMIKLGRLALVLPNAEQLQAYNRSLEQEVARRTQDLEEKNAQLERKIQEHRETQQALQESSEFLRAILETVPDGVITIDASGRVQTFNPAAQQMFARSADEVIDQNVRILMPQLYQDQHDRYLANYHVTGKAKIINIGREVTALRSDGKVFPIELAVGEVRLDEQRFYAGVIREISGRKQAERDLYRAKAEAETANRAKSEFLAKMSHEIRTPMNGVLGMAEVLAHTGLDEQQRLCLRVLQTSGQSLLDILNNVLDIAKIESGELNRQETDFDPGELATEVLAMLQPRTTAKGLQLRNMLDPQLPPVVHGDAGRLRQVLVNLLTNAIKYTTAGHIELRLQRLPQEGAQYMLRGEVEDTGVGIDEQLGERIFEIFSQAKQHAWREPGSVGLGLTICREIISLLGGEIGYERRREGGTTFWFTVRLQAPVGNANAAQEKTGVEKLRGEVLLAEDNLANQEVARLMLDQLGVRTQIVGDGKAALDALQTQPFDLVLMDCQMPELDGYEATREWRQERAAAAGHLPIVALTANVVAGTVDACLQAGMDDYLSKRFTLRQLHGVLARWLPAAGLAELVVVAKESTTAAEQLRVLNENALAILRSLPDGPRGPTLKRLLELYLEQAPGLFE